MQAGVAKLLALKQLFADLGISLWMEVAIPDRSFVTGKIGKITFKPTAGFS